MIFRSFSKRQRLALCWWNQPGKADLDGILCDGAVRSGKTMAITCGFFLWSMSRFRGQTFALCGKTVSALRRNLILPLHDWLGGLMQVTENRAENKLTVRLGDRVNTYYLFGGQDESSYMLIQGITLAGVLLDEVVLMPRSFVEQAVARCSVAGAKLWFSCNPGSPEHWFYREWVCKCREKRLLRLHFTMEDNPALPPQVKARYGRLYTGLFYRRYVLGQWCAAEGRIYDFDPDRHMVEMQNAKRKMQSDVVPAQYPLPGRGDKGAVKYYISVDYGVHNPFSAGLWAVYPAGGPMWSSAPTGKKVEEMDRWGRRSLQGEKVEEMDRRGRRSLQGEKVEEMDRRGRRSLQGEKVEEMDRRGRRSLQGEKVEEMDRWGRRSLQGEGAVAVRIREFYHDGRSTGRLLTDEEYHEALEKLADGLPVERVIIDPSAASMIALLRKRKIFRVRRADNRVLPGIRLVGSLLQQGRLLIGKNCRDAIREFGLYVWQDDGAKDAPVKENDHAMDDIRYFCMSVMKHAECRMQHAN